MHIICIVLRYNKPNKLEINLLHFFNKTSASVKFLEFHILNYEIFINKFQYSVVTSFIVSGVGLVLFIWFVIAVVLNSENNFLIAKLTWYGVV